MNQALDHRMLALMLPSGESSLSSLKSSLTPGSFFIFFIKRFYLFIFRERGREGEREGEKQQCAVTSRVPPTGDLAYNPGKCPDWESNQ